MINGAQGQLHVAVFRFAERLPNAAAHRLRMIFEEPARGELKRATIAGFEPDKAPRFGAAAGMDPSRASRGEAP